MSSLEVTKDLYWVGVLDHKLRVFDVVMETEYGTSYNSYILKTSTHTVLFETAKLKFMDEFISNLREVCNPEEIDYIVVDHTEPDHVGSLEKLLDIAPKAKIVASQIAINFLTDICNREIPAIVVKDKEELVLGNYTLQFLSVPFLHWPDSIYTYIKELKTIVTCDSFGCHYADEKVFNDKIENRFVDAYKYYFDMIMGPFKPYVQYALNKLEELELNIICPGHGPVLREDLNYYLDLYDKWSQQPEPEEREKPLIINSYVSAYGYTEELASEINKGIKEVVDVEIRTYDMVYANSEKVLEEMKSADGILVGSPTVNGDVLPPVMDLIMGMNGVLDGGKVAGAYGSYGWSGEGPEMLMSRLQVLRMNTVEPALKICFKPDDKKRAEARDYGKRFGKKIIGEWEKLGTDSTGKTYWKCTVCGEIFEGALPPISCPVCGVGPEGFIEYIPEVINYKEDREIEVAIIGSGIGAVSAAEAVRVRNKTAKITIYTNEKIYPYHRPVLTKAISEDLTKEELYIYPEEYYKENNIDFELGVNVEKINKDNKSFELNNNQTIHYDKLIIATGARCFIPPFPGADLEGIFTLRKFSDLIEVREILDEGIKNVVVIGGGLLGLENADNIALKGHNVTVIEACPTILPRQLDSEAGTLFAKSIEESKVKLIKGVFVDEIIGDGKAKAVRTKDGEEYPCDLVLVSAGIRSNLELARDGGLETNRGIVVNSKMQTSDSNIYAVGDCAELDGQIDGIWETSLDQGKIAGANIAGDIKDYSSKVFGATLNAFGTSIFSIGDIGTDDNKTYRVISCKNEIKETYKKVYISNNKLVGGILIGNISQTNLLVQGVSSGASVEDAIESKLI